MAKSNNNIQATLFRWWSAKHTLEEVKAEADAAKRDVVEAFKGAGVSEETLVVGDKSIKGTLVEPTQVVIDEGLLLSKLTKKQAAAITIQKVDRELLEAAVKMGIIDPQVVTDCSESVPKAAYVLLNEKQVAEEAVPVKRRNKSGKKG